MYDTTLAATEIAHRPWGGRAGLESQVSQRLDRQPGDYRHGIMLRWSGTLFTQLRAIVEERALIVRRSA